MQIGHLRSKGDNMFINFENFEKIREGHGLPSALEIKKGIKGVESDNLVQLLIDRTCNTFSKLSDQEFLIEEASIKRYIEFYVFTYFYINQHEKKYEKINIKQYSKTKFGQFDNDAEEYDKFLKFYDTFHNKFSKLNKDNTFFISEFSKPGNDKQTGQFSDIPIHQYKVAQLEKIVSIYDKKSSENDGKLDIYTTYKRIRTNKFSKIMYKDYEAMVMDLEKNIEESGIQYKNLSYYQIERKMSFQLIKNICRNVKIAKKNPNFDTDFIIKDFLLASKIHEIIGRNKYVDIHPLIYGDYKMGEQREVWLREVYTLNSYLPLLTTYIVYLITEICNDHEIHNHIEKVQQNGYILAYDGVDFKNEYQIGKDFDEDDFARVMKVIGEIENSTKEKTKKTSKKKNKK
jgi:hypothetical protein